MCVKEIRNSRARSAKMADKKNRTAIDGTQTLEFDLLDEETQKDVIRCIQERGKISVKIEDRGTMSAEGLSAFKQLID